MRIKNFPFATSRSVFFFFFTAVVNHSTFLFTLCFTSASSDSPRINQSSHEYDIYR